MVKIHNGPTQGRPLRFIDHLERLKDNEKNRALSPLTSYNNKMFLFYDTIFLLYAIFYLPYLLLTKRGYAGYAIRFGLFPLSIKKQIRAVPNIWVHAVSVGEVMFIDGFIEQLRENYPSYQLVVTVTTKTGYELALKRLNNKALVIPSPLDLSFIAGCFVRLINPKIYIAAETEIWPNLYGQLYRHRIPIAVINGRISKESFSRYKVIRFLMKGILNQVSIWCMASPSDARRIIQLGADSSRVAVVGNIKFDDLSKPLDAVSDNFPVSQDELWWVAGSTHPGEENIVLDVYAGIIKENPRWRLVIAPRHIERAGEIIELVTRRGLKAVKFSHMSRMTTEGAGQPDKTQAVIVVDTIGHLRFLYTKASLVFVGKSLRVGGGQNIIEPAFYGKAIVIGPKVDNFRDIVSCFKESNAIVQVKDEHAFAAVLQELSADASKREALGRRALEVIAANQGACKRSLDRLAEFLK